MRLKLSRKGQLALLYIVGGLFLVVAAALWLFKTNTSPERVFWRTIEHSLSTQGVTIQVEQLDDGVEVRQVIRYSLGASNLAHFVTTLSQQGTTVQNETVGTPDADYFRYLKITTDQTRQDGSSIDFSSVLGVWAKGDDGMGEAFSQAVLGGSLPVGIMGVPVGNLPVEARNDLIRQIRRDNVYHVAFDAVKKERKDGRLLYTYDVSVQPVAYLALIKRFSQLVGLHGLDYLDPNVYQGQRPFELEFTIDALAGEVVRISDPATRTSQTYSGHGIPVQVRPPTDAITFEELQQRLSRLQ